MRRGLFFLMFCIFCCGITAQNTVSQDPAHLLNMFFAGNTYRNEKMGIKTAEGMELFLACQENASSKTITSKALVYGVSPNSIQEFLQVLGPIIINGSGEVISDVTLIPGKFWAWEISILRRTTDKVTVGLHMICLSNSGKSVADYPSLVWDPSKKAFYIDKIDRSQF